MADRYLYTVSIPEQSQTKSGLQGRREVASEGALTGGKTPVETLGVQAGERTLTVQYQGYNDTVMGEMLNELAESDDIETVAYYGIDTSLSHVRTPEDGYYAVERAQTQLPEARSNNFPDANLTLRRVGTKKSQWRTVTMEPTTIENPFGNAQDETVGLPSRATKVRWWDGDIDTAAASVDSTVITEHGDVDMYDHAAAPYSTNTLVFELPYDAEGEVDVKLWDTRGSATKTSTVDGHTVMEWQKVFDTQHEFEGDIILSNGRVRLTLDEAGQTQSAEEYTAGSWSDLALGTSDWAILDADPLTLSEEHLEVQTLWEDTVGGSTYILNALLRRGDTRIQFWVPDNLVASQGAIPTGLSDLLSPVAGSTITKMNQTQDTVARSEVRQ